MADDDRHKLVQDVAAYELLLDQLLGDAHEMNIDRQLQVQAPVLVGSGLALVARALLLLAQRLPGQ